MRIRKIFQPDQPPYIIAEVGFNHEGDMELAQQMIRAAAAAGADAVKFQSFRAIDLALPDAPHFSLIRNAEMDFAQHRLLSKACREAGVDFLSTPFSREAVAMLDQLGVPAFKVASMDLTNRPLLQECARRAKPILLSTGMACLEEIQEALDCLADHGARRVALLHCLSKYPCEAEDVNLAAMTELKRRFDLPVGYSDHYPGTEACRAAGFTGARVIETHFTMDTRRAGGDHAHSADPGMLKQLVADLGLFQRLRGHADFFRQRPDRGQAPGFRRGLYAARDLCPGQVLAPGDLLTCRPVSELGPNDLGSVVGAVLTRPIKAYQPMRRSDCA